MKNSPRLLRATAGFERQTNRPVKGGTNCIRWRYNVCSVNLFLPLFFSPRARQCTSGYKLLEISSRSFNLSRREENVLLIAPPSLICVEKETTGIPWSKECAITGVGLSRLWSCDFSYVHFYTRVSINSRCFTCIDRLRLNVLQFTLI